MCVYVRRAGACQSNVSKCNHQYATMYSTLHSDCTLGSAKLRPMSSAMTIIEC